MHLLATQSQTRISHRVGRSASPRPRWQKPRVSFAVELEVERTMLSAKEATSSPVPQDRPCFHLAPKQGWLNDPNGPLFFNGRFHMFFQHLEEGCEWAFGLVWGHAVSNDLIHWEHLPVALAPTKGFRDADGCFSGCATIDTDGTPTILYTGVRLRSNTDCGPLPPPNQDLQLPFVECQLLAVADKADDDLAAWKKVPVPFIDLPPADIELTGWRDPFVVERPGGEHKDWVILIGAGLKGVGGTVLVYRSTDLRAGWRYDGTLCTGHGDTGLVWECPLLIRLNSYQPAPASLPVHTLGLDRGTGPLSPSVSLRAMTLLDAVSSLPDGAQSSSESAEADERFRYFFTVSPDACSNPVLYWLGSYADSRFALEAAAGPFRLDLGDVVYAPNIMTDGQGRHLLWAWLQERRTAGAYDYAGCMTCPRVLTLAGDRLHQEPVPELVALRTGESCREVELELPEQQAVPLTQVGGPFLDLDITFRQGDSEVVGMLLHSWQSGGEGGTALLYTWETSTLQVIFEGVDPATLAFSMSAPTARAVGGQLATQPPYSHTLHLRVLLDHSVLEVFTGGGEVLTTRVYRGSPPPEQQQDAGIDFVAYGGAAAIARLEAHEMGPMWKAQAAGKGAAPAVVPPVVPLTKVPTVSADDDLYTEILA